MKIVCDNCTTKYQIADEKVSGKAFKIRCKKCGHVIVVNKSPGEPSSAQQPQPEVGSAPVEAAPPAAEPAPAADAVWHLVIDREQVGPMTAEEVKAKIKGGQVDAETYGWKEGFEDWLKLSAIDNFKGDFATRGSDDQATRRADPAAIQQPQSEQPTVAPGADLFAAAPAPAHRAASPVAPTLVGDVAQIEALAARSASAVEPQMSNGQESEALGAGKGMMGARSENSVLFSLNNLSALAGNDSPGRPSHQASAQDKPGYAHAASEASGLIDIRAMAAATLSTNNYGGPSGNRGGQDMLIGADVAPVFAPVATNMLMPSQEPQGIPKWVFALVGVGGLAIVGMIVFLIFYLQGPPTPAVVATGPTTATTGPGTTTTAGTGTTATDPAVGTKPAGPGTTNVGTPTPPTKPPAGESGSSGSTGSKSRKDKGDKGDKPSKGSKETPSSAKPEKEPEIPAPPPKAEPPVKKEKPAKAKDDLDSLLDTASSGSGGKPKAAEKKDLPEQLERSQISSGFKSANMGACKDKGASGTYMVKLTIGRNGRISDANVVSGGEGKDCVASAVKGAKFPEFSGDPMSLTYPFIVR